MIWPPRALAMRRAPIAQGARLDRRALLHLGAGAASLALAPFAAAPAFADQWVEVNDDAGAPIPNLRVPAELDPFGLPGVLWFGPQAPEVILFDFSDYNCPVCRQAIPHLDALVRETQGLRLGIVHNPILSPKSREAARVVLLTLRLAGPERAYDLHRRLFALRGTVDGARAMGLAKEIGVDIEAPGRRGFGADRPGAGRTGETCRRNRLFRDAVLRAQRHRPVRPSGPEVARAR